MRSAVMRSAAERSAAKKGEGAAAVAAALAAATLRRSCARCAGSVVKRPTDKRPARINLRMSPPCTYVCSGLLRIAFDDKPRAPRLPAAERTARQVRPGPRKSHAGAALERACESVLFYCPVELTPA